MVGFVAFLKSRIVLAGWIMYWLDGSYRLDRIAGSLDLQISLDLDRIGCIGWTGSAVLAGLDHNGWMRTHRFFKDGTDGTDVKDGTDEIDGLDGALVGLGWDWGGTGMGWTVVSSHQHGSDRTEALPLAGWLLQTRDKWDIWT